MTIHVYKDLISNDLNATKLSETRSFEHLLPQVPIDVIAGWAAYPVNTRPLDSHLNSWVTIGPHFNHLDILTTTPIICRCKLGKQMPSVYVWHSG